MLFIIIEGRRGNCGRMIMKILVIEDEAGLREAIMESLRQEGYLADGTGDGKSGLDMIRSGLYDLAILDVMLPEIGGIDVLTIARKLNLTIPIILVSALSQLENKIEGMDSGADDYVTKPFEMQELLARIRMVTRRQRASDDCNANILKAGDLILDILTLKMGCCENHRTVQLAKKEYHMLEYLMANCGQVLTREQITLRVWGYESETEYNNVDVYISYLRKKMKYVKTHANILTVRGMGYKLEEGNPDG